MRIALIPSAYFPSVGGVEVLTARIAAHLAATGHDVEVWAPRSADDGLPETDVVHGIPVRRFVYPAPRLAAGPVASWPVEATATLGRLRRAHREFRPDVLHVQCFSRNGAYATALSRLTGTPLVVTLQGETVMDDHDIYTHSAFLRWALRRGLRRASRVTGCSQFTLDDSRARFGLDPSKATVIFNGVDEEEVVPQPVEVPFRRYVAALGRVVEKKGFDLLIDAFADVAHELPDLGLVIGGEGAALPALWAQVEDLGVRDRVWFPGRLNRGQVAGLLATAEIFVMPSRLEPFGIVALEGWRAGIPVVVTSRGGPPEFVDDGRSGLVVDPADRDALAAALRKLATDPGLRESLGRRGRERLPEFAWERLTRDYVATYSAVAPPR